jgi:hypothetical protein
VATGLGIADINQDGWDDIITANGNDIFRQTVSVYYNNGDGTFPVIPSWNGSDIDYHGHLAIGDINGDNLPDAGCVKVYFNQGSALEPIPSYHTADSMFTFSCALGDADGDGDLDLAVAGGQPYNIGIGPYQTQGRVYFNNGGVLQTLPGWKSQNTMAALDVDFADMDRNGYLDLVFACHLTPNHIFLADAKGNLDSIPAWSSQDNQFFANSLTIAPIDNNEYPDLVVSDNSQLGGQGKFKAYYFNSAPSGQTNPSWLSPTGGYGSAVIAEDLDANELVDLVSGRWWGQAQIYPGKENGLAINPNWISGTTSVIEAYALRDLDQDNFISNTDTFLIGQDSIHVVYLSQMNVEKINFVKLNGEELSAGSDYCYVPNSWWISTKPLLKTGDQVIVQYIYSFDRDLAVSNWDSDIGNYIFYNQQDPTSIASAAQSIVENTLNVFPNPFNQSCTFQLGISNPGEVKLEIFDIAGRRIRKIQTEATTPGTYRINWDGKNGLGMSVVSGIYFYQIKYGIQLLTGKVAVVR